MKKVYVKLIDGDTFVVKSSKEKVLEDIMDERLCDKRDAKRQLNHILDTEWMEVEVD